jgi:hypothetical protein
MHSQNPEVLINVLKGFSEHRITSNKLKDTVSGEKRQVFFEMHYNFSQEPC